MQSLVALLPLLVFVVLLIGLRWSAAAAGLLSAAACLAVAVAAFAYPLEPIALLGPVLEALFTSASILWIIFPALGIYEFQTRSGATDAIGRRLASISSSPQIAALLLAWFFALFLEGAAGFGTPLALVAPMLVALGFPPLRALVMALLGHAAGVSFGAVGTPIVPLMDAAGVEATALSLLILIPHAALGWLLALIVFLLARPAEAGERVRWPWALAAAALFFAPAAALAWFAGPELPTLGGALIGAVLFALLARWKSRRTADLPSEPWSPLLRAALPYLLVLLLILLTRLIAPFGEALQRPVLQWDIGDRFGGTTAPFYHPGTVLIVALAAAALVVGRGRMLAAALRGAAVRLPPVALALVAVLLLARFMVHSGMIDALARSAVRIVGTQWPLAAPLVAALGSFVTGSATASNIILADFQVAAAGGAGLAPLVPLAGQGFGAAIGNVIAPHNIVAGAATVGLVGREGDVLKRTLPVCLAYALAGGGILWLVGRAL